MHTFLSEIRQTLLPDRDAKHGPLPPLLIAMTLVTGLVDAFSYLVLGHVFVANMTGNIVFLGFAVAGAHGFSITASLAALASFAFGAVVGGNLTKRLGHHRGRFLSTAAAMQAVLLAASVLLAALSASPVTAGYRYLLIVVLGAAMGLQNAGARKLAVPDLTTTVLTLTITGIAADSAIGGGTGSIAGRRLISVAAMLTGAVVGGVLVVHAHIVDPLIIALIVTVIVAATARALGAADPAWVHTQR